MSQSGVGAQGIRFGTSQNDRPAAGFEELAVPLFDSLYNFARWLVHNSSDAEDLVQETYLKALRELRIVSARHQFPGLDVQDPQERLSKFMLNT